MEQKMGPEKKSRSQLKREIRELRELGIELAGLAEDQLQAMPLSAELLEAVLAAKGMTRIALKRQYGRLTSLLEREDVASIRAALLGELQPHADEVAAEHEIERWRDRLLSKDGSHLTAFVEKYRDCDPTYLRQLLRNAKKEDALGKPPKSSRLLFKYIRDLSERSGEDAS